MQSMHKDYTTVSSNNVGAALNLLREALGAEEQRIRWEGSQAMATGDYETAEAVLDFAKRLLAFTKKVEALGKEWKGLEKLRDDATPEVQAIISKRFFGRIGKGEITLHQEFFCSILERAIQGCSKQDCRSGSHRQARRLHHWRGVLWGGAAVPAAAVRVDEEMKAVLKPTDYEHRQSSGNQIRWRNTAQWARNTMVNDDGRIKKGSRNGSSLILSLTKTTACPTRVDVSGCLGSTPLSQESVQRRRYSFGTTKRAMGGSRPTSGLRLATLSLSSKSSETVGVSWSRRSTWTINTRETAFRRSTTPAVRPKKKEGTLRRRPHLLRH